VTVFLQRAREQLAVKQRGVSLGDFGHPVLRLLEVALAVVGDCERTRGPVEQLRAEPGHRLAPAQ
jgi:hypothetical protein